MHANLLRRIDDVSLNQKIVPDEQGRSATVSLDPTHACRRENDNFGPVFSKERMYRGLLPQIEGCAGTHDEIAVSATLEGPCDRRADHPLVSGHVDEGALAQGHSSYS